MDSVWVRSVGNLPALFNPGPSRRGIWRIKASEAKNASYFFARISFRTKKKANGGEKGKRERISIRKPKSGFSHSSRTTPITELLDELLVFVELLQSLGVHVGDAVRVRLVDMLLVTEHADLHLRAGQVLQARRTSNHIHRQFLTSRAKKRRISRKRASYRTVPEKRLSFWGS